MASVGTQFRFIEMSYFNFAFDTTCRSNSVRVRDKRVYSSAHHLKREAGPAEC